MHDEALKLPIHEHLQFHASQYKQKTQHPSLPLHKHYILLHSKSKKSLFLTTATIQQTFPQTPPPHTVTTTDIKTNMCHIHISIVSKHLATRGNKKILRTPPPHLSRSEDFPESLVAPLPNSEQINLPSSNHIYTKSTPTHIHHHYAPSITSTHTQHLFNCTHIRTTLSPLDLWEGTVEVMELLARWRDKLAGGPQVGSSDSPTNKGQGSR